jgi:hypothetical protein
MKAENQMIISIKAERKFDKIWNYFMIKPLKNYVWKEYTSTYKDHM